LFLYDTEMIIEPATIQDVDAIHQLINSYAELDRMLFRQKGDIFEYLQTFSVARDEQGRVIGCCALQVIWRDIAEIKSLAVAEGHAGKGIGRGLVTNAVEKARQLKLPKVMALTLEKEFFEKIGFEGVDKKTLPMKVWRDCAKCAKQANCDEFAYVLNLGF